jgi:hypothetical protein
MYLLVDSTSNLLANAIITSIKNRCLSVKEEEERFARVLTYFNYSLFSQTPHKPFQSQTLQSHGVLIIFHNA